MKRTAGYIGLAVFLMAAVAEARVTRVEISRREAFAGGQSFGSVGAYEKVVGRIYGELDPAHPLNAEIVDLDRASRNARGRVEYSADFYILKPVDMTKGNGGRDGAPPDSVRIYLVAGTQHIEMAIMPKGICALPHNPVDLRPVLRTVALALDRWVKEGTPDGSLVEMAALGFPAIPGVTLPSGPNPRPRFDYGPDYEKGIIGRTLPEILPDPYRVLVPKVDADGNEAAGIRLPDIVVPTGTVTGWAVRSADAGGAGELCYLDGSFVSFPKTKAEREAKGDPRLSLEERYRDKVDYTGKVRQAALALEREGYLLQEDVQRIVDRAPTVPW